MKAKELPPIEVLREFFDYNPETGELRWKVKRGFALAGDVAGTPASKDNYLSVKFAGRQYRVHRICWALFYGEDPYPFLIDHIHGAEEGNAITNLRKATVSENTYNQVRKVESNSGHRGVQRRGNRWRARIFINGKHLYLGNFDTREEAINARLRAEQEHGIFVR